MLFKHTTHHLYEYLRYQVTQRYRTLRIIFFHLTNLVIQVCSPLNLANYLARLYGAPVDDLRSGEPCQLLSKVIIGLLGYKEPSVMKLNAAEPVLNLQLYCIRLKSLITFHCSSCYEGLI